MAREIKFRVWSEEDKEYRKDCRLLSLFDCVTGCPAIIYNDENDRFDIEQYTGLKDKNGKEIYEGDILNRVETGLNLLVIWRRSGFGLVATNRLKGCVYGFSQSIDNLDHEIIGNVHENKELLGGEE